MVQPVFLQHIREEDALMVRYMDVLRDINAAGFLTNNSQAGHKYKTTKERAYICGFMPRALAPAFIRYMSLHTDKVAMNPPMAADDVSIPSNLDIPLTVDGETVHTHMPTVIPVSWAASFRKALRLNAAEDVVYIFCYDTRWGRDAGGSKGLFTEVHNALTAAAAATAA